MTKTIRRNTVVYRKSEKYYAHYGRVNRRIDDDHFEVIFVTREVEICPIDDLVAVDYKGRWNQRYIGRDQNGEELYEEWFSFMATLRNLKQRASIDNPDVWKKNRKRYPPSFHRDRGPRLEWGD